MIGKAKKIMGGGREGRAYLCEERSRDISMKPSLTFSILQETESSLKFTCTSRDCTGRRKKGGRGTSVDWSFTWNRHVMVRRKKEREKTQRCTHVPAQQYSLP